MSFFNIFKKKKTTEKNIDAANEPITWKNTTNASDFFEGYNIAITDLSLTVKLPQPRPSALIKHNSSLILLNDSKRKYTQKLLAYKT